jgi:hypothetical protein
MRERGTLGNRLAPSSEKIASSDFFETLHGRPAAKSAVFAAYLGA